MNFEQLINQLPTILAMDRKISDKETIGKPNLRISHHKSRFNFPSGKLEGTYSVFMRFFVGQKFDPTIGGPSEKK